MIAMLTTAEAAAKLKITVSQLNRLLDKFGVAPDDTYTNPKYKSAAPGKLYTTTTISNVSRRKEVKACQLRATKNAAKKEASAKSFQDAIARAEALRVDAVAEATHVDAYHAWMSTVREARVARAPTVYPLHAAHVENIEGEELIALSLDCMHALNRRAKHLRDSAPLVFAGDFDDDYAYRDRSAQNRIYALKDQYLSAMARAGRATVETFTIEKETHQQYCGECDREWIGDSYCRRCHYDTGATTYQERWFVFVIGRNRFHSPAAQVAKDLHALATPCESHNPTQPAREVPDVLIGDDHLAEDLQRRCVERAIAMLSNSTTRGAE